MLATMWWKDPGPVALRPGGRDQVPRSHPSGGQPADPYITARCPDHAPLVQQDCALLPIRVGGDAGNRLANSQLLIYIFGAPTRNRHLCFRARFRDQLARPSGKPSGRHQARDRGVGGWCALASWRPRCVGRVQAAGSARVLALDRIPRFGAAGRKVSSD